MGCTDDGVSCAGVVDGCVNVSDGLVLVLALGLVLVLALGLVIEMEMGSILINRILVLNIYLQVLMLHMGNYILMVLMVVFLLVLLKFVG